MLIEYLDLIVAGAVTVGVIVWVLYRIRDGLHRDIMDARAEVNNLAQRVARLEGLLIARPKLPNSNQG